MRSDWNPLFTACSVIITLLTSWTNSSLAHPIIKPTMPPGLSLRERPNGEQIERFRPLHRPNHPKQNRDFH